MAGRRRQRVEHTEDWEQLRLLVKWPEQERYEEIRPLVLFGDSVFERTEETRTSERTLYRRVESFERDGVESLFATERARRKVLPPWIRGLIVNLKAEYPPFNLNEIANVVYVHSGRKPDVRTVRNVLEGSALPLKIVRLFDPYHEIREGRERRMAVVSLHSSGWSAKAIADDPIAAKHRFADFATRCCSCGKKLTNDISKVYGIGPECRKGLSAEVLANYYRLDVSQAHAALK